MKKAYLNPDTMFPSQQFGFTQAVTTEGGKFIHVAGQTAWDKEMNLIGEGDLAKQIEQSLNNVGLALEAAGAGLEDIVRLKLYVVDYTPDYLDIIASSLNRFFENPPANTLLGVQALALPGFMIEIEATAVV